MTPPGGTDTESSTRNCKCSSTRRGHGGAPAQWPGCPGAGAHSGDVQRSVVLAHCDRRRRAPSGCGQGRATLKPIIPSSATVLLSTPRRYEEWRSPGRHRELSHCRAPPGHGTTRVCRPRVRPIGTVCRCSVPKRIYPQIHEWRHRRGSRSVPENRQSGVGSGIEYTFCPKTRRRGGELRRRVPGP